MKGIKMKLFRKNFEVWKDDIYIMPTIEIRINNMMYEEKNFSIMFHWIVFHARLLWLKDREK